MSKKFNIPEKHTLNLGNINMTIWLEDGKIKQSGHLDSPECIAEFSNTREGKKQAQSYIHGMKHFAQLLKSTVQN